MPLNPFKPPSHAEASPNAHPKQRRSKTHPHLTTLETHLIAASGKFVGTFLFLYFAYAGQVMLQTTQREDGPATTGKQQTNIYTALVYGFSLLVNVWAFYRISGGLLNPAVSILSGFAFVGFGFGVGGCCGVGMGWDGCTWVMMVF